MWKKLFIIAGVIILLAALFVLQDIFLAPPDKKFFFHQENRTASPQSNDAYRAKPSGKDQIADPQPTDVFITANFVDLSQIQSIAKFRSCHGHDVFSTDFNGDSQPLSAMKMYFRPIESLQGTNNKVRIFAPFDGTIVQVDPTDTSRGRHYVIRHEPFNGWYMTIFHQTFSDADLHVGTQVKAGQFLSYGTTNDIGHDFDIALQRFTDENAQYDGVPSNYNYQTAILRNLEPIFPHMTPAVAAQWEAKGVNVADTAVSKDYREANPCTCIGEPPGTTECNFDNPNPDKIILKP